MWKIPHDDFRTLPVVNFRIPQFTRAHLEQRNEYNYNNLALEPKVASKEWHESVCHNIEFLQF